MTTYNAIKILIQEKIFKSYSLALDVIFDAYDANKIEGYEVLELAELADKNYPINK